ncbi:uncharacterized protein [Osmerus mordax]|uniref:uncharacterized protein n=1 Tax=Osmerus mordax TaxID=8014 RepID=UPI00351085CB
MGGRQSSENVFAEEPLIQDISVVLIGKSGKNRAGNIILGRTEFTFFTSFRKTYLKIKSEICKRNITLVRTPGSIEDTKHCVRSLNPNFILLVIDLNNTSSDACTRMKEAMVETFNENIWSHTMLLFILKKGQKFETFDDNKIHDLKQLCHNRFYTLYTEQTVTSTIRPRPVVPSKKRKKNTEHPGFELASLPGSPKIDRKEWTTCLCQILDELLEDDIKRFKLHLQTGHKGEEHIPAGALEKPDKEMLVQLLLRYFGVNGSVIKTRDALKFIPRYDLEDKLMPFLSKLGETW